MNIKLFVRCLAVTENAQKERKHNAYTPFIILGKKYLLSLFGEIVRKKLAAFVPKDTASNFGLVV